MVYFLHRNLGRTERCAKINGGFSFLHCGYWRERGPAPDELGFLNPFPPNIVDLCGLASWDGYPVQPAGFHRALGRKVRGGVLLRFGPRSRILLDPLLPSLLPTLLHLLPDSVPPLQIIFLRRDRKPLISSLLFFYTLFISIFFVTYRFRSNLVVPSSTGSTLVVLKINYFEFKIQILMKER